MNLKAKFRAWLIDLVREAIRIERTAAHIQALDLTPRAAYVPGTWNGRGINPDNYPGTARPKSAITPQQAHAVHTEPSFEQMQAEAIQAQAKFYEGTK